MNNFFDLAVDLFYLILLFGVFIVIIFASVVVFASEAGPPPVSVDVRHLETYDHRKTRLHRGRDDLTLECRRCHESVTSKQWALR